MLFVDGHRNPFLVAAAACTYLQSSVFELLGLWGRLGELFPQPSHFSEGFRVFLFESSAQEPVKSARVNLELDFDLVLVIKRFWNPVTLGNARRFRVVEFVGGVSVQHTCGTTRKPFISDTVVIEPNSVEVARGEGRTPPLILHVMWSCLATASLRMYFEVLTY